jgi:hypothetical protein
VRHALAAVSSATCSGRLVGAAAADDVADFFAATMEFGR